MPFGSRKAWAWPPSKQNAWLWPPQGASGAAANPDQKPPLPAAAVLALHSEIDCTPTAWIDYIGHRSVPGVNTPVVAADPGFFKGRVVAQTNKTAVRNWVSRSQPAFATIGQRPWVYVVGRLRNVATLSPMFMLGSVTPANNDGAYINAPGLAIVSQYNGAFTLIGQNPMDTSAHRFKYFADGTNANFTIDHVNYSAPFASALAANWTSIAIGTLASVAGIGYEADASIAYLLICSSKPTAAEEAALDAWAARYWGVPDSPPLPASTHSWWSGSHGMTPATAFDQMPTGITLNGTSILAADLPMVAPDPSTGRFNGQPVGQFNRNAYWGRTGLVTTIAAGDRPWLYLVARMRSFSAAIQSPCGIGVGLIPQAFPNFGVGDPYWYVSGGNWNAGGSVVVDTLPHRFKTWVAGAIANLTIDDVPSTSFGGGALATSTTSIWIGIDPGANFPSDSCVALFMICKSKPTSTEEAALDAWAKAFYGLP